MSILGSSVSGYPKKPDFAQKDESKPDFIKNKPDMDQYLKKTGGTMTGALSLVNPTEQAHGATKKYVDDAVEKREKTKAKFLDTSVAAAAFANDSTYADYPFRAAVALDGVVESMIPEVIFSVAVMDSVELAPVADCYNGGVYIYAAELPESAITIPTIICWR